MMLLLLTHNTSSMILFLTHNKGLGRRGLGPAKENFAAMCAALEVMSK
eukprot:CAMPEP_0194765582 /NCGR_PEP_ID=MMETSP0323_2-20130528/26938_1 /TAXON_ID=2866 ORGANISM="Crypthecodinium cohnii, Strain Seligo" /NCGR_SAMPLE_ID=MMETSP0323_2 /ASSEMBLY_ACC=CAM_ASM_000346 /LENGTH=47 /DNA_ID= /DNA_START= /DNA_END= /DNA_ORIENTATION=